jgi:cytochrome c peroxidase
MKQRKILRLLAVALICVWIPTNAAWGANPPAALFANPLNQAPIPEPPNLFEFVKSKPAAIKLGKALFWDMQVGSDGVIACASCHFHAGADNRLKNTVNPGSRGGDNTFQVRGPNETLQPADFPFHDRQNPDFQASPVTRDFNDVVGSQGVRFASFVGINPGSAVDSGTPITDTVFQVGGQNMRRVTARNTPSVINAVFNFHNFWDGRAHFLFNGVNPFGPLDTTAGVWFSDAAGNLTKQKIAIENASLASQATGPPLDDTEMSFGGRTFPQLGRKMLSLTPLGKQLVHPGDSVLGPLSRAVFQGGKMTGQPGLDANYEQMIKDAFVDTFWKSAQLTPDGFTQMEANFSLFWGLAIQLYEATLVSDQTPFDRLLGGDSNAITDQQERGMNIFFGNGKCDVCHAGIEFSTASVAGAAFVTNLDNAVIDQMPVSTGQDTIYDIGFNPTGVRPMVDDIGREGNSPFPNPFTGLLIPLDYSTQAELQALGNLPFATVILPPQLPTNFPVSNGGAFKVPGLRNIELTAPYFHNGSAMTLEQMIDFYTRGGNFPSVAANPDLDFNMAEIGTLQNAPDKMADMVEFMKSLTDERVRNHSAPFDHPELFVPEGVDENGNDIMVKIAARDALGNIAPSIALTIDDVISPTNQNNQVIGGIMEVGSSVSISVNGGSAIPADTLTDNTWSATVTGLVEGINTIQASAVDSFGNVSTIEETILLDTASPALTFNAVATPTANGSQTVSGTVDPGVILLVSANTSAIVSPVTLAGGAWSAQVSGLTPGANAIGVAAIDSAGNFTFRMATIYLSTPLTISDALKALRISVSIDQPTFPEMNLYDVSPLVGGVPSQSGSIDVADSLLVLRKVVGLAAF